jgi:uncharacterized protein (TIGR04168 family)
MGLSDQKRSVTIAVVGDIHDQWSAADEQALQALAVDLVLFVGDIGNEAVDLVRQIAALDLPKAVILGNHDAWYSATDWGRKKCPYDRTIEDRVRQQLDALGEAHVGYGKLDLPALELTVIGGRPFSWGGSEWKYADFYRQYYSVNNFAESVTRLRQAIDAAAYDHLIFMGHCGPTGLGAEPEDPCGRDWNPLGGDFGDPDLAEAIAYAQTQGKTISLVTFGHMHHGLRHRKDQLRRRVHPSQEGILHLNAASVPRWVKVNGGIQRNFSLVKVEAAQVTRAALVWVDEADQIAHNEVLFEAESSQSAMLANSRH